MSAQRCLTAWKPPMGRPNWTPALGVLRRPGRRPTGPCPTCRAAVSTAPSRRHQAATSGPATGSPGGQRGDRPHRGERVHRPGERRGLAARAGSRRSTPSSDSDQQDVEVGEVLDDHRQRAGARGPGRRALDQADHHRAVVGPVDQPGGQVGGDQGPGHQRPAELLEDQGRLGQAEAHAAGLLGQAEVEHPGLAQLAATRRGRRPARSTRGRGSTRGGKRPSHSRRMPSASSVWNSVTSKSIGSAPRRRRSAWGSLGSPRMRSPTMLRWICEVPAAMVREIPRSQSSTMVAGREHARARRCPRGRGRPGRPGPSRRERELAELVAGLGVGQLEVACRRPRGSRCGPPGTRCAWSAPTGRRARPAGGRPGGGRRGRPRPRCAGPAPRWSTSSSTASSRSPTKAVPRSKLRVTMVTRQPSFSSPTRLATGTRTSSRNSSANSVEPAMVCEGPDVDPGRVHGQDQPRDAPVAAVLGARCGPAARSSRPPRRARSRSSAR